MDTNSITGNVRALGIETAHLRLDIDRLDHNDRANQAAIAHLTSNVEALNEAYVILDARLSLIIDALDNLHPSAVS
jgi:hypothetical protein